MNSALVVMAAGLGSRYGGVKQIDRVGPAGEILMEYAIFDALRAGFDKLIVIIKPEMLDDCRELFGDRIEAATGMKIHYAFQNMQGDYAGIPIPAARSKPLGTVHALLSAAHLIDRPFAALNADDYYGSAAFAVLEPQLHRLQSASDSAMVAYLLKNTVSPYGGVTRGVCAVEDGLLRRITETYHLRLMPDGTIREQSTDATGPALPENTPVSMNIWGFHPDILPMLDARFRSFLRALPENDNKSECLLPVVLDELIVGGSLRTHVLETADRWFGLTYREDKPGVMQRLQDLHEAGVYPPALWNP